jgi:glutamine synthetase
VSGYATDLCERADSKSALGVACKYEKTTAAEVAKLTDALLDACTRLEKDRAKVPADARKAMEYSHKTLVGDMAAAREIADRLETLTASEYWPFPVYSDLLFSV